MGWRVGAAIGATFTDVGLIDEETGTIGIAKDAGLYRGSHCGGSILITSGPALAITRVAWPKSTRPYRRAAGWRRPTSADVLHFHAASLRAPRSRMSELDPENETGG